MLWHLRKTNTTVYIYYIVIIIIHYIQRNICRFKKETGFKITKTNIFINLHII